MFGGRASWRARYTVLSVVMLGMIISSIDKTAMSVAIPYIAADLHFSATAMGAVMSVFFVSYAISQVPGGLLADKFGVRKVATVAMVWWSIFTGLTGATTTFVQLLIARLVFGLGEGVFPPSCFAAIAIWFPRKERATANAIMFSATLLGGALAPLVVVAILAQFGWRAVFYSLFFPGIFMALLFWSQIADRPSKSSRVSDNELLEIQDDRNSATDVLTTKSSLYKILFRPEIIRYFLIYMTFDLAYWGFTTWLPTYLVHARGFSMIKMGLFASLPSFAGTVGCFLGGWLSDRFFSKNRRLPIILAQLTAAIFLYLVFTAQSTLSLVIYQVLGGFFLMSFFGVFWALPMNTVSADHMGLVGGLINMAGQIAAFAAPLLIGLFVDLSRGGFGTTFAFLIGCLLMSSALVLTIPATAEGHLDALTDS